MNLRNLYTPVQPAIQQSGTHVTYREYLPAPALQSVIYCYWQLKTDNPIDEPFTYRVVADGCIDIYFDLSHPPDSYVMGFCKRYTEFELGNHFNYVGIRFLPTMFPQLFRVNAAGLTDRYADLEQVVPTVAKFIRLEFDIGLCPDQLIKKLDCFFLKLFNHTKISRDSRMYEAIDLILSHSGVLSTESDLNTGISSRQLRRLFQFYIGDTPKTFCQVVRFQTILRSKPSNQSLKQNKVFYDLGYYDQAHFIKEFKHFYGVTPSKAFGR